MKPDENYQLANLQSLKTWKSHNYLMLTSDKTEVIVLGTILSRDSLSSNIVNLDSITLVSSTIVRNLGVIFDQHLYFKSHVKQISRTAFFHLHNIAKIWHIVSQEDAEKTVHAFVTSRLDYCDSLFSGFPNSDSFSPPLKVHTIQ